MITHKTLNSVRMQRSLDDSNAWPSFFVSLDGRWLKYDGSSLVSVSTVPAGDEVAIEAKGKRCTGAFCDGEAMVMPLEDGTAVVFELSYDPEHLRSWPIVRIANAVDFEKWKHELSAMEQIL